MSGESGAAVPVVQKVGPLEAQFNVPRVIKLQKWSHAFIVKALRSGNIFIEKMEYLHKHHQEHFIFQWTMLLCYANLSILF